MPRMSVSMTLPSVRARIKRVTRRHEDTWVHLKPGDRLTLIEKGMGLPKGAKQVVVCDVDIVAVDLIPLWPIGWGEIKAEGLWDEFRDALKSNGMTPSEAFCRFWLAGHGYKADTDPATVNVRRIEWDYLPREDHLSTGLGL